MPAPCSSNRTPQSLAGLLLATLGVLALAGCPAPASSEKTTAVDPPATAPPVVHFSGTVTGVDEGPTYAGKPAQELVRMAQQVNMNLTSIHKAQETDFALGWPAGLLLPGNSYVDTDGVLNYNPANGSLQGCVLVHLAHDDVLAFLKTQLGQFGTVEVTPGAQPDRSWSLVVQPSSGPYAGLSCIVARSNFDAQWSLLYLEFVAPPSPGQPATGQSAAGAGATGT